MKFLRYLALALVMATATSHVSAAEEYNFFQYKHAPGGPLYIEPADQVASIQQRTEQNITSAFFAEHPLTKARYFARYCAEIDEVTQYIEYYKNLNNMVPRAMIIDPESGAPEEYNFVKADGSCWTQNDFMDVINAYQNARNTLQEHSAMPMEM